MSPSEINIFVSYSHKNLTWIDKKDSSSLVPFLEESLKEEPVSFWYDHDLKTLPGIEYEKKIYEEIDKADIAILLLSQDFVNSDFIRKKELPRIKERWLQGKLEIIPILVEPWTVPDKHPASWLIKTQIIPGEATPLIDFTESKSRFKKERIEILEAIIRTIGRVKLGKSQKNQSYQTTNEKVEEKDNIRGESEENSKITEQRKHITPEKRKISIRIILSSAVILVILVVIYLLLRPFASPRTEKPDPDNPITKIDSPDHTIQRIDTNKNKNPINLSYNKSISQKETKNENTKTVREKILINDQMSTVNDASKNPTHIREPEYQSSLQSDALVGKVDFEGTIRIVFHESFYAEAIEFKNILTNNKFRCFEDKRANDIIFPKTNFIYYYRKENVNIIKLINNLSQNFNFVYEFTVNSSLDNEITIYLQ